MIKLSPPADGKSAWAETILYSFGPYPDAANPRGGLLTDASGNLYTATTEGGPKQFFGTIVKFSGTGFAVSGVAVTK